MMPNGDPRDGFFYPTLTLMIDSYIMSLALSSSISSTRCHMFVYDLLVCHFLINSDCLVLYKMDGNIESN